MRVPIGVCDVVFRGQTYFQLADAAVFEAMPTYETLSMGQFEKRHILSDYLVSLDLSLNDENYDTLKLAYPALKDYGAGLYDNPSMVNYEGEPLIIHPISMGDDKEYDITIFSAILDPEKGLTRTYAKGVDAISIRFLGQPSEKINGNKFKSYFFIGDTEGAGIQLWRY
ncbi:hypothetical protein [Virgibacillus sp. CBA3643]|uniref:hypothetical protein n=1 Tax=Virgibacillus sp. CBA3643 TaxID=2942278 RepID=UPI0035A36F25